MASWSGHTPWYLEQRQKRDQLGRRRRTRAWLLLGFAVSCYMTGWSIRSFLG